VPSARSVAAAAALPQPTPYARQLVKALSWQDRANVLLTAGEAEQWKKNLAELIQLGPDGAAAIAEFLQSNTDVRLGRAGLELLGVDSLREALFNALVNIAGPEAISATLQALQISADPREIALLAGNLDRLAPEMHRQDAVHAAREVLAMAENGRLSKADVAPLFEVLYHYGGSEVVPDLERACGTWAYYSAVALAKLPDGAGIPSLIQIAEQNGPARTMALQQLAQLSADHESAGAAFANQIQSGRIAEQAWPFLVSALAGNECFFENTGFAGPEGSAPPGNVSAAHVRSGNQTFYSAFKPGSLSQDKINQRLQFLEQLRAVTDQPAARQALQQAAELLMFRLRPQAGSLKREWGTRDARLCA